MAEKIITRKEALSKGLKNYFTGKPCKNGHVDQRNPLNCTCRGCDRSKKRSTEQSRKYRQAAKINNPEGLLYYAAKSRAKRLGRDFTIKKSDIQIPERCPCCSVKLEIGGSKKGKRNFKAASLDRIDNEKGYVKGNVAVMCWRCNHLKRSASLDELENIVTFIKKHNNTK